MKISEHLFKNIWEHYEKKFGREKDAKIMEQCKAFIKNYLAKFEIVFADKNIKTFMSLSEIETEIVRIRFGLYNDGEIQMYKCIVDKLDVKNPNSAIAKLERNLFEDLNLELSQYLVLLERPGELSINELVPFLSKGRCDMLRTMGFFTIEDLTKLKLNQVYLIANIKISTGNKIINAVHAKGYRFADEISLNSDIEDKSIQYDYDEHLLDSDSIMHAAKIPSLGEAFFETKSSLSKNRARLAEISREARELSIKINAEENKLKELTQEINRLNAQSYDDYGVSK